MFTPAKTPFRGVTILGGRSTKLEQWQSNRGEGGQDRRALSAPARVVCHTKIGPPKNQSPRNVRGRKVGPPRTFAAEKSVRRGPSVAPQMVRPRCRWSPVLKAFFWPYLDCRRSVLQFETLLASTGHRALLPALPTPHRALLPALRGFTFTLAYIYHKTMQNPNPTLNYLFLYHEIVT